ncbi:MULTISPECIES: hypothetical protein [Sphingomonas]|uniref:hypothetical protein n=1 Tax=Sphingomonas TaxID=13687 RepID=UPI001269AA90|nr:MULTISPECIES: hypothetical protein [Sphingomonas]
MTDDHGFDALVEAIFDHLPLFFGGKSETAHDALAAVGYRMARQADGTPMLARPVGDGAVCLFAKPALPLPKAKLAAAGAAHLFDRLAEEIRARGFARAAPGTPRDGMRVETFAARHEGPIMAITVMRALASDNVLLAAAMPPVTPRAPVSAQA